MDEQELSLQAERIASRLEQNPGWDIMGKRTRQKWVAAEVRLEQIEAYNLLSKVEYEALTTEQLEIELCKRHKLSISELL